MLNKNQGNFVFRFCVFIDNEKPKKSNNEVTFDFPLFVVENVSKF